jgi:hypothetical protein
MRPVQGRSIDYDSDEKHILRRLAGALVVLWADIPREIREALVRQAAHTLDRHQTVQLAQQIQMFINECQRGWAKSFE